MNDIFLSVIIPAYNESRHIKENLFRVNNFLSAKSFQYEIIVVDDGSSDTTADVVRLVSRTIPQLRLVENAKNRGKGFSVWSGMQHAQGEYRLFMDADGSVDISHIDEFITWMKRGYDVTIGSIRIAGNRATEHNGWHRRLLGNMAIRLIQILATPGIEDTQRGFKLFSAAAAGTIFSRQTIERFGFDIELLLIARINQFKIKELPVVWDNPPGSTVTSVAYFQTLVELFRIVYNRMLGRYKYDERRVTGILKKVSGLSV